MNKCDSNTRKKTGVKRNFSIEEKKEFARLYNEGYSLRKIGQMFDTSKVTIKTNIKDLVTFRPKTIAKEQHNKEKIINMYEEGKSISYISKQIGVSSTTVKTVLGRANIDCVDVSTLKYAEYLPKIIELAYEGKSLREISEETNICKATLSSYLNWLNKIPKDYYDKNRTYNLDIGYVLSLERDNLYELGLLLSTYTTTNRNGILGVDLYIHENILKEHFRITRKFTNKKYFKADNYKRKPMYVLNIISEELFKYFKEFDFESISKLSIDERKSFFKGYLLGCITHTIVKNKIGTEKIYLVDRYQIRFPNKEIFYEFLKYLESVNCETYFKVLRLSKSSKNKNTISFPMYNNDCEKLLRTFDLDINVFKFKEAIKKDK